MKKVLVIEDDAVIRSNLLELLEEEGFEGIGAADGKAGIAAALAHDPDVVVCDIMMPVMDGHHVLRALRSYPETAPVPFIFLTARAQRSDLREGMSLGADDYVTKPFTRHEILDSIRTRLERQALHQLGLESCREAQPEARVGGAVVEAPAMREVYAQATRAAASNLSILLLGETGVGKDVLSHSIHKASGRASGPFVPLNCAALSESLLESELFGHEKGAFTGAVQSRPGLFEAADGGTVYLDEIGDLPKPVQVKLLRVLEERRVMRVGGRESRPVDVRFVAATNHDLDECVRDGRFRQDLFFRIAGITLHIPPLRERREEIRPLAMRFLQNARRQLDRPRNLEISPEAWAVLESHHWPGNVRELRNAIERAVALSGDDLIRPDQLPPSVRQANGSEVSPGPADAMGKLRQEMRQLERQRIAEALDRCGGNQTRAAKLLGISRRTLLHRLDEYGLPRPRKG